MEKSILKSWTFWFGLVQVVYGGVGFLAGQIDGQSAMTLVITGLGTIGLRLKTTVPVTVKFWK